MRSATSFLLAALVASLILLAAQTLLDKAEIDAPQTNLDVANVLTANLAKIAATPQRQNIMRIFYLGDSTAMTTPPDRGIPAQLRKRLRELPTGVEIDLRTLAAPGLSAFDFYFLADTILAARPDRVVITFNPASASAGWRQYNRHPELAGWIEGTRLCDAVSLPIADVGVTIDRLFFYSTIVRLNMAPLWQATRSLQARAGAGWEEIAPTGEHNLGDILKNRGQSAHRIKERMFESQRLRYASVTSGLRPDDPTLRMLAATVRYFTERDVDVLVFAFPMNVSWLQSLGVSTGEDIARSMQTVAAVVEAENGQFLDLHAIVPRSGFADRAGHLGYADGVDGPAIVAESLMWPLYGSISSGARAN